MEREELIKIGLNFDYEQTQVAYKSALICRTIGDYTKNGREDFDSYFNDFDSWWKSVSTDFMRDVYKVINGEDADVNKAAKRAVAGQICNMLQNDIIDDNGTEPFSGWCADGEVFEELDERTQARCMYLVEKISPLIDYIVYEYLNTRD